MPAPPRFPSNRSLANVRDDRHERSLPLNHDRPAQPAELIQHFAFACSSCRHILRQQLGLLISLKKKSRLEVRTFQGLSAVSAQPQDTRSNVTSSSQGQKCRQRRPVKCRCWRRQLRRLIRPSSDISSPRAASPLLEQGTSLNGLESAMTSAPTDGLRNCRAITRRLMPVNMPGDRCFPGNEAASPDESRAAKRTSASG